MTAGCQRERPFGRQTGVSVHDLRLGGLPVTTSQPVRWSADDALTQLYAAHWRSLVRLATLLVGDEGTAEDVTQDAFVAMHRRWSRLTDPEAGLAYLRQSVVNGSRSELRHRAVVSRRLRELAGRTVTVGGPASQSALEAGTRGVVLEALRRLPQRQREVLVLRHYLELSEAEIAATLGISPGSVKTHASRGAAALRAALPDRKEEL